MLGRMRRSWQSIGLHVARGRLSAWHSSHRQSLARIVPGLLLVALVLTVLRAAFGSVLVLSTRTPSRDSTNPPYESLGARRADSSTPSTGSATVTAAGSTNDVRNVGLGVTGGAAPGAALLSSSRRSVAGGGGAPSFGDDHVEDHDGRRAPVGQGQDGGAATFMELDMDLHDVVDDKSDVVLCCAGEGAAGASDHGVVGTTRRTAGSLWLGRAAGRTGDVLAPEGDLRATAPGRHLR